VLAGIRAVTGPAGCLLVVKNYTGDRLNFGLAAERARAEGLAVETVIVGDDIALPDLVQPRGVAGTLFVHKIAGHLAETGAALPEVAAAARAAAADVRSLGIALAACSTNAEWRRADRHAQWVLTKLRTLKVEDRRNRDRDVQLADLERERQDLELQIRACQKDGDRAAAEDDEAGIREAIARLDALEARYEELAAKY